MQIRLPILAFFIFNAITTLANVDSIGVENNKGKKLIIHKVESRETYYSISRRYQVVPSLVMDYNGNAALQPGDILKIPTERPFTETASPVAAASSGSPVIDYKVEPKETLYSISRKFNTTVEDLRQLNNLKGSTLSIGQIIKVRQGNSSAPVTASVKPETPSPAAEQPEPIKAEVKVPSNRYGLRAMAESGAAVSIDDESIDGSKLLVLHRTAPIGTVMKITNPMTEKSTFAKVVGKFTENESTKDVIIVVTKATADLLGALDKRFRVNIDYGITE